MFVGCQIMQRMGTRLLHYIDGGRILAWAYRLAAAAFSQSLTTSYVATKAVDVGKKPLWLNRTFLEVRNGNMKYALMYLNPIRELCKHS